MKNLFLNALRLIESKPRGSVYASRKGIYAGTGPQRGVQFGFRRENGRVHGEMTAGSNLCRMREIDLDADIEARAAKMLDSL